MSNERNSSSKRSLEICNDLQNKKTKTDFLCDNAFINFNSVPSLQSIASASIVVGLWTEQDMKNDVQLYSQEHGQSKKRHWMKSVNNKGKDMFKKLEGRVLQKLGNIFLPNMLKKQLALIIKPIGLQLMSCFCIERNEHCRPCDLFKEGATIYFTMKGTIDHIKSLKEQIKKNKMRYVSHLYELSCKYCLEEHISDLWAKLTSKEKKGFESSGKKYEHHILAYWTAVQNNKDMHSLISDLKSLDEDDVYKNNVSIFQNMVYLALHVQNPYAFKYFWRKLTDEDMDTNLKLCLRLVVDKLSQPEFILTFYQYNIYVDILYFLLSQLKDGNKQLEILQMHASLIFMPLVKHWPNQDYIFPTITAISPCFYKSVYGFFLSEIVCCGEGEWFEIFNVVWTSTTVKNKKLFIKSLKWCHGPIMTLFFNSDEQLKLVLAKVSLLEKKKILFSQVEGRNFLNSLISHNSLDSLVTMFLTIPNDVIQFKELIMSEYADNYCYSKLRTGDIQDVDMLLNWGFETKYEIRNFKRKKINLVKTYIDLVCVGNSENVDRFLNWYLEREKDTLEFKRAFTGKIKINRCKNILFELEKIEASLDFFSNFVKYNFRSAEEVEHFKKLCLESYECFEKRDGFRCIRFDRVLLKWCLGSDKEVTRFKMERLFSQETVDILIEHVKNFDTFKHFLHWYSPIPTEEAARLKSLIGNRLIKDKKKLGLVYDIIDKFTVKDKTS